MIIITSIIFINNDVYQYFEVDDARLAERDPDHCLSPLVPRIEVLLEGGP
jgi:hypothetical protein